MARKEPKPIRFHPLTWAIWIGLYGERQVSYVEVG